MADKYNNPQVPEFTPSPEYVARKKRVEVKKPDRIPIFMGSGYLLAETGGITHQDLYEHPEKAQEILEELALQFQPDLIFGLFGSPEPSRLLGDQMAKWPGYGLGPKGSFQFNEQEFMKAKDYDAFLEDLFDFAVRTYLPRAFKELEGLASLPPLGMPLFGFYNLMNLNALSNPPVASAFEALNKAMKASLKTGNDAMNSITNNPYAGIPLHRGSDGFISIQQFEKFYWPQLKDMMLQLIAAGITPWVFYEGVWDQRLEYLAELPKGKTAGLFQSSDIFKIKEVLGDTMCIMGGMPVTMLVGGTVSKVREYTHELCERVGKGGGYIMTTNVLELEGCNTELIKAWVDATRGDGVYS